MKRYVIYFHNHQLNCDSRTIEFNKDAAEVVLSLPVVPGTDSGTEVGTVESTFEEADEPANKQLKYLPLTLPWL